MCIFPDNTGGSDFRGIDVTRDACEQRIPGPIQQGLSSIGLDWFKSFPESTPAQSDAHGSQTAFDQEFPNYTVSSSLRPHYWGSQYSGCSRKNYQRERGREEERKDERGTRLIME